MLSLKATIRSELGKRSNKLRRDGQIPAVLYGRKVKSTPLTIGYKVFEKIYSEAGENTLVTLEIEKGAGEIAKENTVLIRDAVRNPLTRLFMHTDFYQVPMDEKIKVSVPIAFINESPVVKDGSAVLARNIYELEISALPKDLPREITVDLSRLQAVGDAIMLKDIVIPFGVETELEKDFVIAAASAPVAEEGVEEKSAEEAPAVADIKTEGEIKREDKAVKEAEEAKSSS